MKVVCSVDARDLISYDNHHIPVLLYGTRYGAENAASIGSPVWNEIRRFITKPSNIAFDFLTIALAVTACDSFVSRDGAPDGWCREIHLKVPLADSHPWMGVISELETALRFLTGDTWRLEFTDDGCLPPDLMRNGSNVRRVHTWGRDCISLFSGGMDSAVGAADLIAGDRSPLLVSHAYPKDRIRQDQVAGGLQGNFSNFSMNADPVFPFGPQETSMRSRSLNFIAFGTVAASVVAKSNFLERVELIVPENGFISVNPPLTRRRIGSLSTRTTHPFFMQQLQNIMDKVDLKIDLSNPYRFKTKGEMLSECRNQSFLNSAAQNTVSCGKWKRHSRQCGRCVPCIVRRAAFYTWGIQDPTDYRYPDLHQVLAEEKQRDDLLAFLVACTKIKDDMVSAWSSYSGRLPNHDAGRNDFTSVVERGLNEVKLYLSDQGLVP